MNSLLLMFPNGSAVAVNVRSSCRVVSSCSSSVTTSPGSQPDPVNVTVSPGL